MQKIILPFLILLTVSLNVKAQINWKEKFITKVEISNSQTGRYDEVQIYTPYLKLYVNSEFTSVKITDQGLLSRILGRLQETYYDQAIFIGGVKVNTTSTQTIGYRGAFEATNKRKTNYYLFKGTLIFYNLNEITNAVEVRCQQKDGNYVYYRFQIENQDSPRVESKNANHKYIDKFGQVIFSTDRAEERISGVTKTNVKLKVEFVIDLPNKYIKLKRQDGIASSLDITYMSDITMDEKSKVVKLHVKDRITNDVFKLQLREDLDHSFSYTMYWNMKGEFDYITFYKKNITN